MPAGGTEASIARLSHGTSYTPWCSMELELVLVRDIVEAVFQVCVLVHRAAQTVSRKLSMLLLQLECLLT